MFTIYSSELGIVKKRKMDQQRAEPKSRMHDSSSKFIHLYLPGPNNETGYLAGNESVFFLF